MTMTLLTTIQEFSKTKVLCIGDIMLDHFMYGKVSRISPEAPVPIFHFSDEKSMLGGAGNVVANLRAIGCPTTFLGVIGNDASGQKIVTLLDETGCHSKLLKAKDIPTIVKTRFIAGHNHLLRADFEEKLPMPDDLIPRLLKLLHQAILSADIVLLSDYDKGVLNDILTPKIIKICQELNKPVLVDPKTTNYHRYYGATLVKPNLKEFSAVTGLSLNPTDKDFLNVVKEKSKALFKKFKIGGIVLTLSEYGMLYIDAKHPDDLLQIPTKAREVYDVSGAGDTSLAVLGASIGAGASVEQAIQLANTASGIVVAKLGTATVSRDELIERIQETEDDFGVSKILTIDQAKKLFPILKSKGKKIGFTNGCFDLIHLGHLSSLKQAKEYCDILVVGVNSDASIKRYKGSDRPIQNEETRSNILAALEVVDYVIVFNDDTALPLVQAIRPDIIAKEGYTLDQWPEAQWLIKNGGKAINLKRIEGHSTTSQIEKMKG